MDFEDALVLLTVLAFVAGIALVAAALGWMLQLGLTLLAVAWAAHYLRREVMKE